MSLVYHERPGVYSSYDASSIIARGATERVIALIGKAEAKEGLYRLHSYAEAKEAFAEGSELGRICLLYTSPSPRDSILSRMPSSA